MEIAIPQIIIGVICILIIGLYIAWKIYNEGLRTFIIKSIVEAEKTLDDNQEKFNLVCQKVIDKLPFPLNLIPVSMVNAMVQKIFDEVKTALDYVPENK